MQERLDGFPCVAVKLDQGRVNRSLVRLAFLRIVHTPSGGERIMNVPGVESRSRLGAVHGGNAFIRPERDKTPPYKFSVNERVELLS